MRILLFAGLAELLKESSLLLQAPWPQTVEELKCELESRWPALQGASYRVAVNQSYVADESPVRCEDEIALIPPVSGG